MDAPRTAAPLPVRTSYKVVNQIVADYTLLDDSPAQLCILDQILKTDAGVVLLAYGMGGFTAPQLRAVADFMEQGDNHE